MTVIFSCSNLCNFRELTSLVLDLSYWGESHKFSQLDLDNIIESSFPKLRNLVIYASPRDEDTIYHLSESIYNLKDLEVIELCGPFVKSELSKITSFFTNRSCKVLLFDL